MSDPSNEKQPGLLELLEQWEKQGASDTQKAQRVNDFFNKKARKQGIPIHGTFELTPVCNFDCKMCYVHMSEAQLSEGKKRLLTVDQWKSFMQQAIDAGMISAILTGGECLTYPWFDELYLFLLEKGIEVTVKTNGVLLTEKRVAFFTEHPPFDVVVTLYGADEDTYEKVTGRRAFSVAIEGIKRSINAGIHTVICITPNRYMVKNAEELILLADSLGCPVRINSGLFNPRDETERTVEGIDLTEDEYFYILKLRAKLRGRILVPVCENEIPEPNMDGTPSVGMPCGGGRSSFAIHWNGIMHPCLMMDDIHEDLTGASFTECWDRVHRAVCKHLFPGECLECVYRSLCPSCVVQHEMGGSIGQANKKFCQRARRLVKEGLAEKEDNQ